MENSLHWNSSLVERKGIHSQQCLYIRLTNSSLPTVHFNKVGIQHYVHRNQLQFWQGTFLSTIQLIIFMVGQFMYSTATLIYKKTLCLLTILLYLGVPLQSDHTALLIPQGTLCLWETRLHLEVEFTWSTVMQHSEVIAILWRIPQSMVAW